MKTNLIRVALLAFVSFISLTVYSQSPRGSNESREMDKPKPAPPRRDPAIQE